MKSMERNVDSLRMIPAFSELPPARLKRVAQATEEVHFGAGDVIIRLSSVWHRGMPNKSKAIRPMLAFTWEDGGSELADPYTAHGGRITLLTNRYAQNLSGRLQERAFASLPALGKSYLFIRSVVR